jgi:hypothetical protein
MNEYDPALILRDLVGTDLPAPPYVIDGFLALLALGFFLLLRKLVLRFVIPEHDEAENSVASSIPDRTYARAEAVGRAGKG